MDKIKGKLGFGFMRLPVTDNDIDYKAVNEMVDLFQARGFNYYDTAHGYLDGKSESAVRECLVKRYPRDSYLLCNKLSVNFFEKQEDIRPFFEKQLEACGVEYFDVYLMHSQISEIYKKFKRCNAYEEALALKKEGKLRHFGISFHDTPQLLEEILISYPEIEVVQIQFNYADFDNSSVQSKACYDVCRRYGKQIIVMEPIKGGSLVKLPKKAEELLVGKKYSPAGYALRFAGSYEGIATVLSGMGDINMVEENTSVMGNFVPLDKSEFDLISDIRSILREAGSIPCTDCRYCISSCPQNILIPDLFTCYNNKQSYGGWNPGWYYKNVHTVNNGKASDCIGCGTCEGICPQHLHIIELLKTVAKEFEK